MPKASKNRSGGSILKSKWVVIGGAILMAMFALGRLGSGLVGDGSSGGTVPEPDCADAISWEQAADHDGEQVTVRGPVVDTHHDTGSSGQPTFLNLGAEFPDSDRFTVVIWNDVRQAFPERPEALFAGQEVCVAGDVQIYEGSPQIELAGADAIRLVD